MIWQLFSADEQSSDTEGELDSGPSNATPPLHSSPAALSFLQCDETLSGNGEETKRSILHCAERLESSTSSPAEPIAVSGTVAASADVFAFGSLKLTVLARGENPIQNHSIEFTKRIYTEEEQNRAQLVFWYCALVDVQTSASWKNSQMCAERPKRRRM